MKLICTRLCYRHHTLAFVPSSGMIYAFGCGTRGQLGTGHTCNVKCPSPVKGHWAAHNGQLSGKPGTYCAGFRVANGHESLPFIHCGRKTPWHCSVKVLETAKETRSPGLSALGNCCVTSCSLLLCVPSPFLLSRQSSTFHNLEPSWNCPNADLWWLWFLIKKPIVV